MALKKMPARAPGLSGEARMLTKMATVKKQEQQRLLWALRVGFFPKVFVVHHVFLDLKG